MLIFTLGGGINLPENRVVKAMQNFHQIVI